MLKIVVFDSGFGGELFADRLEEELPIVEVIRVIDWRHAAEIQSNPRKARKCAEVALAPYMSDADLIVFANHLLSATSLKYFQNKYKDQKFVGLDLKAPETFIKRDVLIMTTKPLTHTISYRGFILNLKRNTKTVTLDSWTDKIDDGELLIDEIRHTLEPFIVQKNFKPEEVILACAHLEDIKTEIKQVLGHNIKIYDSFDDTLRVIYKTLKIRGMKKKK